MSTDRHRFPSHRLKASELLFKNIETSPERRLSVFPRAGRFECRIRADVNLHQSRAASTITNDIADAGFAAGDAQTERGINAALFRDALDHLDISFCVSAVILLLNEVFKRDRLNCFFALLESISERFGSGLTERDHHP